MATDSTGNELKIVLHPDLDLGDYVRFVVEQDGRIFLATGCNRFRYLSVAEQAKLHSLLETGAAKAEAADGNRTASGSAPVAAIDVNTLQAKFPLSKQEVNCLVERGLLELFDPLALERNYRFKPDSVNRYEHSIDKLTELIGLELHFDLCADEDANIAAGTIELAIEHLPMGAKPRINLRQAAECLGKGMPSTATHFLALAVTQLAADYCLKLQDKVYADQLAEYQEQVA